MVHQGTSREEPALDNEKNIIHDFTLSEVDPSMLPKAFIRTGHGIMEVEYYIDEKRSAVRVIVNKTSAKPWDVALIGSRRESVVSLIEDDKDSFVPVDSLDSKDRTCGGCGKPISITGSVQHDLEELFYHKFQCDIFQALLKRAYNIYERTNAECRRSSVRQSKRMRSSLGATSPSISQEIGESPRNSIDTSDRRNDRTLGHHPSDTETIDDGVSQPRSKKGRKHRVNSAQSTRPRARRSFTPSKVIMFFEGDMPEIPQGVKRAAIFEF